MQQMVAEYPYISAIVTEITHDDESILGTGCDDLVEFKFAIDLILDGIARLHEAEQPGS